MSKPFELGQNYMTKNGERVTIMEVSDVRGYECVRGNDTSEESPTGIWRYNREHDRGRVTGSPFDMSDQRNLTPEE